MVKELCGFIKKFKILLKEKFLKIWINLKPPKKFNWVRLQVSFKIEFFRIFCNLNINNKKENICKKF